MSKTGRTSYRRSERRKRKKQIDDYAWAKKSTWRADQSRLWSGEFELMQEGFGLEMLRPHAVEEEKRLSVRLTQHNLSFPL